MTSVGFKPVKATHLSGRSSLFTSSRHKNLLLAILLAAVTVALYFPVHHHPFLNLDDNQYVTENTNIQEGLNWDTVRWAFTASYALNWHPLTWLSHALDVEMFALEPGGHHDVNLLFHVLNVVLLFWVLQRATGYAGRSAMVAALFAVHPMNVETVAWVAERKNVLSMFFFLLALAAYRWYARQPGIGRYATVALCFALGLMAKPQVITLPFVLLLWDYWPLRRMITADSVLIAAPATSAAIPTRKFSWLVLEKVPLLLLSAASAVLTVWAQRAGGVVASLATYSLSLRMENALVSYALYLKKAFWPTGLALMHLPPGTSLRMWQVFAALILLLGITELVLRARRQRYLLVGWLWFLGTLVPMIGLVQVGNQSMADRYAYLPYIGLWIMVCWGVPELWLRSTTEVRAASGGAPKALVAASIAALLALALVTHRQLGYWGDNLTLWSHVTQVIGPNSVSEDRMGDELMKRRQPEAAIVHFRLAAAINPSDPDSNLAVGIYEQKQGDLTEAIRHYQIVVRSAPHSELSTRALTHMGRAYHDLGDTERERESLQAAGSSDQP